MIKWKFEIGMEKCVIFQGDSGGPLIVEREDKRYELIGM